MTRLDSTLLNPHNSLPRVTPLHSTLCLLSFDFVTLWIIIIVVVVIVQQRRLKGGNAGLAAELLARGQGRSSRGHHPGAAQFSLARSRRQIRAVEELRKQNEVAKVHGDRQFDVHRRYVAGPARGLDEGVRPHVDRAADDHLRELQRRDEHRDETGRIEAHGAQCVVRVHQGVHAVVHDDEPPRGGSVFRVAEPGVHEHGDVVVPVQEDERLFPQHNEDRVAQFG